MVQDLTARLLAHAEAMSRAKDWAQRGLILVKAGKIKQAAVAEQKAKFWLAKAQKLEPRTGFDRA